MRSVQGKTGGYVLTRPAADIAVLDVVQGVDGASPAFTAPRSAGEAPAGHRPRTCTKPCPIARAMSAADAAWRASLQAVSIADLVGSVEQDSGPEALPAIGTWLDAALGSDG